MNLPFSSCLTSKGKSKNELVHTVTFKTIEAAIVAAQLRPGNEKYPYKRNDRQISVHGLRKCYGDKPCVNISQETVCDLKGENDVVATKTLPLAGKKGQTIYLDLALNISVLPKNIHHVVAASMHPFYSANDQSCRFKGVLESMSDSPLGSQNLSYIKSIRCELDEEFVTNDSGTLISRARLEFTEDATGIIKRRQCNAIQLISNVRREATSNPLVESEVELSIPSNIAGLIIGRRGATIKGVETVSNCKVRYNKNTSIVTIFGKKEGIGLLIQEFYHCQDKLQLSSLTLTRF